MATFDDAEGEKAYQVDPIHVTLKQFVLKSIEEGGIMAVDFTDAGASTEKPQSQTESKD